MCKFDEESEKCLCACVHLYYIFVLKDTIQLINNSRELPPPRTEIALVYMSDREVALVHMSDREVALVHMSDREAALVHMSDRETALVHMSDREVALVWNAKPSKIRHFDFGMTIL